MMEIKFRAWDKHKKQMVTPHDGDFISWHAPSNWKDCYEVMQFTGLKDKNGKEIYEYDICKYSYINYFVLFKWDDELLTFKANVYSDGIECENIFFINTDSSKFEVIGNIYDNPKLINTQD